MRGVFGAMVLGAVGFGCDAGTFSRTASSGLAPQAGVMVADAGVAGHLALPPGGVAPALPHETWRSGYALVELRPGVELPLAPLTTALRSADSRSADSRSADSRSADSRSNDSRGADSHPADSRTADLRTATAVVAPHDEWLGGVRVQPQREIIPRDPTGVFGPIVLVALPDAPDAPTTRRALAPIAADPRVARVEPDRIRHRAAVPNDPLFTQQWSLPLIRLPQAWEITQGSVAVVVAILDTGILAGHPDLTARLVAGYDFLSNPMVADDGDLVRDADPSDTGTIDSSLLHGTHVAGIIGAATNNHRGIAGVDQKCRLMPVRVLGVNGGDGIDSDIADAVRWSIGAPLGNLPKTQTPAHLINMSFGGPGISFTLQRAIDEALRRGVTVIAAAGNGNDDAVTYSPGGLDGVIAVGAVGREGSRASYSNYGPRVDLLAPGGDFSDVWEPPDLLEADMLGVVPEGILSTYRDEGLDEPSQAPFTYQTLVGTSQAAPHVTGAVALMKALLPGAGPRTVGLLLQRSADARYRCPAAEFGGCGAGLLDVESLVQLAVAQQRCGCVGDLYCDEGVCITPPLMHPSLYDRPVIHGGWCTMTGHHPAGTPVGYVLFAVAVLGWTQRRRVRRAARDGSFYEP